MENKKFMIDKIPAVRYGEASDRCFLYIRSTESMGCGAYIKLEVDRWR